MGNSVWDEPFGRMAIEASSQKCLPIISNVAGLEESKHIAHVLKDNNENELARIIFKYIQNPSLRKKKQNIYFKNNSFNIEHSAKLLDSIRNSALFGKKTKSNKKLKILHITNFNDRFDGRLHYNTGKRINNGLIRLGHNVSTISDRDVLSQSKNIFDFRGAKKFNKNY